MVDKVLISELDKLNIIGGQITSRIEAKGEEENGSEIQVLIPKAISKGMVNHDDLGKIKVKADLDYRKMTKEGDIVMKLSTPYDACLITKEDEGLLVPSFCAIINNLPRYISKEYFLAFINSKACTMQIKNLVAGSQIAILSIGQIRKISIPLLDIKEQKEIGEAYMNNMQKIKVLEKIVKLEREYLDSKFLEMEK